ncbi:hypothetical protein C9374_003239 [Naegleria lovaniensis]|uniref:Cation efflux protein transmembrane domain-containing protein n=1 Tax=Naegleria lovaniensis TaxID=51637 RepID=A0AA88GSP3_NAELO|nr:uncharacterized protein C9374_003239 [Naegleria lovaniensis]KAG2385424.1 hypothetical protein C9374_003239 [Naegleria lovaniensis]
MKSWLWRSLLEHPKAQAAPIRSSWSLFLLKRNSNSCSAMGTTTTRTMSIFNDKYSLKMNHHESSSHNLFSQKRLFSTCLKQTSASSSGSDNKHQNTKKEDYDPQKISRNAVVKAIAGNTFITAIKFAAYITSGSATLLAETCHSLIDSLNQGLLYLGIKQSAKTPDQKYQYGYGRARYFYSLVSALGIWWIGSFSVMYNGIQTLIHPPSHQTHPKVTDTTNGTDHHHNVLVPTSDMIEKDSWSYMILNSFLPDQMVTTMMCHYGLVTPIVLLISFIIDGGVLLSVVKDLREEKPKDMGIFQYMKSIQDPMVLAVLLEDLAACLGVVIAFAGIGMSIYTDNLIYDSVASLAIGGLLGLVSLSLIQLNRNYLIGRSIDSKMEAKIRDILMKRESIEAVYAIQSQWLSPTSFSVTIEVDFNGYYFCKVLKELGYEKEFIKRSKDVKELMKLLNWYTEDVTKAMEREIIDIQDDIRSHIPEATFIELEPSSSMTGFRIVEYLLSDSLK